MHTLGSRRVYVHGIYKIKSFVSKGLTWHVALFLVYILSPFHMSCTSLVMYLFVSFSPSCLSTYCYFCHVNCGFNLVNLFVINFIKRYTVLLLFLPFPVIVQLCVCVCVLLLWSVDLTTGPALLSLHEKKLN